MKGRIPISVGSAGTAGFAGRCTYTRAPRATDMHDLHRARRRTAVLPMCTLMVPTREELIERHAAGSEENKKRHTQPQQWNGSG